MDDDERPLSEEEERELAIKELKEAIATIDEFDEEWRAAGCPDLR